MRHLQPMLTEIPRAYPRQSAICGLAVWTSVIVTHKPKSECRRNAPSLQPCAVGKGMERGQSSADGEEEAEGQTP